MKLMPVDGGPAGNGKTKKLLHLTFTTYFITAQRAMKAFRLAQSLMNRVANRRDVNKINMFLNSCCFPTPNILVATAANKAVTFIKPKLQNGIAVWNQDRREFVRVHLYYQLLCWDNKTDSENRIISEIQVQSLNLYTNAVAKMLPRFITVGFVFRVLSRKMDQKQGENFRNYEQVLMAED